MELVTFATRVCRVLDIKTMLGKFPHPLPLMQCVFPFPFLAPSQSSHHCHQTNTPQPPTPLGASIPLTTSATSSSSTTTSTSPVSPVCIPCAGPMTPHSVRASRPSRMPTASVFDGERILPGVPSTLAYSACARYTKACTRMSAARVTRLGRSAGCCGRWVRMSWV